MATAIDNSNLDFCKNCSCEGFEPRVTAVFNLGGNTIEFTDGSSVVAPDAIKIVNVTAYDQHGEKAEGAINVGGGAVVLDIHNLDATGAMTLKATVVTNGGCEAVGVSQVQLPIDGASTQLGKWLHSESGAEKVN